MKNCFFLLLLFCFCSQETNTPGARQLEKFALVYQEFLVTMSSDTAHLDWRERYLTDLLKKHQLSREEFDRITVFMQSHPQAFDKMMNKTIERLHKETATRKAVK